MIDQVKMMKNIPPKVSYIIPTLNAERYLGKCLESIKKQDYPGSRYEILIIDGGSLDETIEIAKKYKTKILDNPSKDPESGKSIGIDNSRGEIIVLMDSDNEIIKKDWLKKMVNPLVLNPNLFGVESYYFSKKGESIFNTYSMILHIADPFSRCLAAPLGIKQCDGFFELTIPEGSAYPLGANGFLWNKRIIKEVGVCKPKFEESNFSYFATKMGYRKFARVPGYGIYHYHLDSLLDFVKKRLKIGNKFLNRKDEKKRTWLEGVSKGRFVFSVVYCSTFIGPLIEGLFNFLKTKQKAWLLHPLMSFISVVTYVYVFVARRIFR